jgi:hypothetical protein
MKISVILVKNEIKKHLKSFSLVELLIVVAVIAILMSLLLPSLKGVLAEAHTVVCMNNMKNIGLGYDGHSDDFNEEILISAVEDAWDRFKWCEEASPYLGLGIEDYKSFDVSGTPFECPSHDYEGNRVSHIDDSRVGGYGLNYRYMGYIESWTKVSFRRKYFQLKTLLAQ